MKKIIPILLVVIMTVLLAVSASAVPVSYETDKNKAFDVSYTGTEGAYYAIVVVEGLAEEGTAPTITENSIQYIDQKTAGAGGAVSFEDILLKVDGTPATVYLGGSDLDEPVLLGWVNDTDEPEEFTVSGTVTSASDAAATVTLTNTADATIVFTVNTNAGAYSVDVTAGTYKMVVTKKAHLSYTKNELVVADDVIKNVTLKAGDVNASGEINASDLAALLKKFNSADENCDVNGSGEVNASDLATLLKNFNATSVVE